MTDVWEVMERRRSIRRFKPEPPSAETVLELVRCATLAPSAMNRQDWHFSVITSQDLRKEIRQTVKSRWERLTGTLCAVDDYTAVYLGNFLGFSAAPVLICVDIKRPPLIFNALLEEHAEEVIGSRASAWLAIQNLLLAAAAKGLGTCVFSGCNAAGTEVLERLARPSDRCMVCLIALGWPDENPKPPPRRPLDEVVTFYE